MLKVVVITGFRRTRTKCLLCVTAHIFFICNGKYHHGLALRVRPEQMDISVLRPHCYGNMGTGVNLLKNAQCCRASV